MADITKETVQHVAKTARLTLSEEETKQFTKELQEIVKAFSQLDEIDTNNVTISMHPLPLKDHTREDTPQACLSQKQALSLAKHTKDGYFKGPKIV